MTDATLLFLSSRVDPTKMPIYGPPGPFFFFPVPNKNPHTRSLSPPFSTYGRLAETQSQCRPVFFSFLSRTSLKRTNLSSFFLVPLPISALNTNALQFFPYQQSANREKPLPPPPPLCPPPLRARGRHSVAIAVGGLLLFFPLAQQTRSWTVLLTIALLPSFFSPPCLSLPAKRDYGGTVLRYDPSS